MRFSFLPARGARTPLLGSKTPRRAPESLPAVSTGTSLAQVGSDSDLEFWDAKADAQVLPEQPLAGRARADSVDDVERLVRDLCRVTLDQRGRTAAVAVGALLAHAGTTYSGVLASRLLVSRGARMQSAVLTLGLEAIQARFGLLENRWRETIEAGAVARLMPWLEQSIGEGPRGSRAEQKKQAYYTGALSTMRDLSTAMADRWIGVAGVVGQLIGSAYCIWSSEREDFSLPLFATIFATELGRKMVSYCWHQHTQQRNASLNVAVNDLDYRTVASLSAPGEVRAELREKTALNRHARYSFHADNMKVSLCDRACASLIGLAVLFQLGWFDPEKSATEQLVAMQISISIANAVTSSLLALPSYALETKQLHTRMRTFLGTSPFEPADLEAG